MQQVENELDQAQEQLSAANTKLDEKEKALQNVSRSPTLAPPQQHPFNAYSRPLFSFFLLCVPPRVASAPR